MEFANQLQWLAPKFDAIPDVLKQLPWAVWKAEVRPNGKYGKAPCNPVTGRKVGANQPQAFGTFEEARAAFEAGGWTGVGVLMVAGSGLVGVDVDDAQATFLEYPEAKALLNQYRKAGGFVEPSPSGNGLRAFALGSLPPGGRRKGCLEIYDGARFLTVTGQGQGNVISDQCFIDSFHSLLSSQGGTVVLASPAVLPAAATVVSMVSQLTATVKAAEPDLWAGNWKISGRYPSQSEADQALANKIARHARAAGVGDEAIHSTVEAVFSQSALANRDKWIGRADYRNHTIGAAVIACPANVGQDEDGSGSSAQAGALAEFCSRYFVAPLGGQTLVFDRHAEDIVGTAMSPSAFHLLHANRMVDGKPISKKWFASKSRETFERVIFDPRGMEKAKEFNLWRGLPTTPKSGTCRRIVRHVYEVWCSRNSVQFKYVIRWMAMLVQRPWEKPEVAIVLRSVEGTGKTILTDVLLRIFGRYGFTAAQTSQVVGNFNGHLMDKILVVLEEAMFAGDPKADSAAKVLISNPNLTYEWKGKDAVPGRSYHHVLILSNRAWAVPVGADARRYAVLDVSAHRKGDFSYFQALKNEIESGGAAAFLAFLLRVNLSGFNPRTLPDTASAERQRTETLIHTDPVKGWWLTVLAEGEFPLPSGDMPWGTTIPAHDLQASYAFSTGGGRAVPAWPMAMRQLKKLLPAGSLAKNRPRGTANGNLGGRFYEYSLPSLADARAEFKAQTGIDPTS